MRKIIALLLAITLASTLLVGCGEKEAKINETTTEDNLPEDIRNVKNAKVGDTVKLDLDDEIDSEQDYYSYNTEYPTNLSQDKEWIVLVKEDNKALLLMKNPQFSMMYTGYVSGIQSIENVEGDYECSFVNETVLEGIIGDKAKHCSSEETGSWIINSKVESNVLRDGESRSEESAETIEERYFLLTKEQVKKYVKKEDRKLNKKGYWWLNSTCKDNKKKKCPTALCVDHNGNFTERKGTKSEKSYVRPAIWLALSEDQKTPSDTD